jgi:hypothetical protein
VLQTCTEENELSRFIDSIVGAMSEPQVRAAQQTRAVTYEFFDSSWFGNSRHSLADWQQ